MPGPFGDHAEDLLKKLDVLDDPTERLNLIQEALQWEFEDGYSLGVSEQVEMMNAESERS